MINSVYIKTCRYVVVTLLSAAVLIPAAARADWKADWDKTVAEAKGQSLKLVLQPDTGYAAVVQEFKKKYPQINVQVTQVHPSDAGPRILTEQKNGLYAWDSWWASASNMNNVAVPANALDKIDDYFILPEVKDPSNWHSPEYLYTSPKGRYVFVHTHFLMDLAVYNKKLLPGGKFTLDSLVDPSLKGKIYIRLPSRPHGGTMMLAQIAKERGIDFVERIFTEMSPVYVDNDQQNFMAAVRGQAAVSIGTVEEAMFRCKSDGGCKDVEVSGIRFLHSRGVSVFKNAPNKAATKVWINWLLSKEGQQTWVREWAKTQPTGAFSMRKDVEGDPAHASSMPDFDHLDKYVAVSLDSGDADLKKIIALFNRVGRK